MEWLKRHLKSENANAMIENVIVLPIVFIIIYAMILLTFMIHDRSVVDAAAYRGAVYAAHCVVDPRYTSLDVGGGELDTKQDADSFTFGKADIKAYRYLFGTNNISGQVEDEVKKIITKTRIPWMPMDKITVSCTQKNHFLYQDITVTVSANYKIPKFFATVGLQTEFEYTTTAETRAVDSDEFLRNADLVVDIIAELDRKFLGGGLEKAVSKISELGQKITKWTAVDD